LLSNRYRESKGKCRREKREGVVRSREDRLDYLRYEYVAICTLSRRRFKFKT
jgi:hypothetical protein